MTVLELCYHAQRFGFTPWKIGEVDGAPVEFVSMPFPDEAGGISIMARTTPGDPTTMAPFTIDPCIRDLEPCPTS